METIKISQGTILSMNAQRDIFVGDILIEGNCIKKIAPTIPEHADKEIDASGKIISPGFIQTHVHLTQSLFKGMADDLELMDWLQKRIWPLEASHSPESSSISAQLGLCELIKGGTTAIIDMESVNHSESAFEAIEKSGMRAITGKCMMDYGEGVPDPLMEKSNESLQESTQLLNKWHGRANGRIDYAYTPRFVVSCSDYLLKKVRDLAQEHQVMVHTHASENQKEIEIVEKDRGMRNITYLEKIGLTGENLILAHCIWLDETEKQILAASGTKVVHCPTCNLKLASGMAPIPELLSKGVSVSLGADGAPCNNNLSIFREMHNAALMQKIRLFSPTAMPAETVFEMATLGGAKAMGKSDQIGSLEPGKKADLIILNLDTIETSPASGKQLISQLVYSASTHNVETTIIDGQILMENRQLKTLNEKSLIQQGNRLLQKHIEKAHIIF